MPIELVPDPEFDDASAWTSTLGVTVTGGQAQFINATVPSFRTIPEIIAVVGKTYEYTIVVATSTGGGLYRRIRFGGELIYNGDGAGTFTGTVTATSTSGLIFQTIMVGQWFIESVSIKTMGRTRTRYRGGSSITSDGSVSGVIEPPPFPVQGFIYKWKNWLNNLYKAVSLNVATNWFNIKDVSAADTPYAITSVDQVLLADPNTGDLTIDLPSAGLEDGISFYIKNIDESGIYDLIINPGNNKIEQATGVPLTTDVIIAPLDSWQLIFDSELSVWWII